MQVGCHAVPSKVEPFSANAHNNRRPLAASQYVIPHASAATINDQIAEQTLVATTPNCAHYFMDPLSWMRPELEQGKLEGRLECPKCHANVGKYAWQGMQCSCSEWVVPGISLAKGRVDQVKPRISVAEIRRPPGAVSSPSIHMPSRQNL